MGRFMKLQSVHRSYLAMAIVSCASALVFSFLGDAGLLPVLGDLPLLPVTLAASALGLPLVTIAERRRVNDVVSASTQAHGAVRLAALAAALAIPPIVIDLVIGFPKGINLALPGSLFFYPAIALVAEAAFHLLPLAVFSIVLPRNLPASWWIMPAVLAEPLFQALSTSGPALLSWLVFGNVVLVSAAQLWLFCRYGFAAMMGLRLAYYAFWHILWGTVRLPLLF